MAHTCTESSGESGDSSKQELGMKTEDPEDSWSEGWPDDHNGVLDIGGPEFDKASEMKERVIIYLLKKQLQDRDVDDHRFVSALHNLAQLGILSLESIRRCRAELDNPGGGVDNLVKTIVPFQHHQNGSLPTNRFLSDFTPIKVLGVGGYGTVIKARHNLDSRLYAVKQIPFEIPGDSEREFRDNTVFREVQALSKMNHIFICRYHNVWVENGYHPVMGPPAATARPLTDADSSAVVQLSPTSLVPGEKSASYSLLDLDLNRSAFLIGDHWANTKLQRTLFLQMEYCGEDTLATCITNWSWKECLVLFAQVIVAVHYIHYNGFIHRDLKPENIFVTEKRLVKVGDFGLARREHLQLGGMDGLRLSQGIGTRGYTAPEIELGGGEYGRQADIYSLGIILWEILNGGFDTAQERQIALTKLLAGQPDPALAAKDPVGTALMLRMISRNPDHRPTIEEILGSEWHKDFSRQPGHAARQPFGGVFHSEVEHAEDEQKREQDEKYEHSEPTAEEQLVQFHMMHEQLRRSLSREKGVSFSAHQLESLRAELRQIEEILPKSKREVIEEEQASILQKTNKEVIVLDSNLAQTHILQKSKKEVISLPSEENKENTKN